MDKSEERTSWNLPMNGPACAAKFKGLRVVVLGDGILDSYLYGQPRQLCREAPVPVVKLMNQVQAPGGAANTAVNVAGLGAEVYFVSVFGKDETGRALRKLLEQKGVHTEYILSEKNRRTLRKQRVIASSQMLLRMDEGGAESVRRTVKGEVLRRLESLFSFCDALIVSDYKAGFINQDLLKTVMKIKWSRPHVTALDCKSLLSCPALGFDLVKPNYLEAVSFLGLPVLHGERRIRQIMSASEILLKKTGVRIAAVTLDQDGALVFEQGHPAYRLYARFMEHPNTAGAGDVFISAFVLALAAGAEVSTASETASLASAIAVGKKEATASCSYEELMGYFSLETKHVRNLEEVSSLARYYRSQGQKIIFTNGCFDILHRGHIHFLNDCKALGNVLFVAVNSDSSIQKIKGPLRPINRLSDRIQILRSLGCIDHVMGFEGDAPLEIIAALKPDLFVKGANHHLEELAETPLVRQLGGEARTLPYWSAYSTREILERGWLSCRSDKEKSTRTPVETEHRRETHVECDES